MGTRPRKRFKGRPGPEGPVVLGMETGGEHLGLALWRLPEAVGEPSSSWRLLEEVTSHRGKQHASSLLPLLDAMLRRQELKPADIALVAVGRGPGGFTGVRVGMATGIGLGLGHDAPVWPVDSLAALALNAAGTPGVALPLFDARKGEVYGAPFRVPMDGPPQPLAEAAVAPHDRLLEHARGVAGDGRLTVFGSGAQEYGCASEVPPAWHVPSAAALAFLAASAWEAADRSADAAPAVDPAYVRPSDAEIAHGP